MESLNNQLFDRHCISTDWFLYDQNICLTWIIYSTFGLFLHNEQSPSALKKKFFIKDFFSKYNQIRRKLWIWSRLVRKFLVENFIFFAVRRMKTLVKSCESKHYINMLNI